MNKTCIKADKFDLSMCGKFNKINHRLKSKARRNENKKQLKLEVQDE